MTSLLEKGKEFKWTDEFQESFDQLRSKLMAGPVLIMPDLLKGKCALGPFLSILVIECQLECLNVNLCHG